MRIGTWNVEYARPSRLPALAEIINAQEADIWVLTETHDDLVPDHLPHAAHSLPRPQEAAAIRPGSRWVSIWSRFPVLERLHLDGADAERTVAVRVAIAPNSSLIVYGTVLPWQGDRGVFTWDEHHRVIAQQASEWQQIRAAFPDTPICVAGDYNTDMATGAYYGTKRGIAALKDGLENIGLNCVTAPENLPENLLPHPPIDHIALPKAWALKSRIASAWPADKKRYSDHSGVVVGIDL